MAENQSYATKRQQNVKIFGVTPGDLLMGMRTDVSIKTLTNDEIELIELF